MRAFAVSKALYVLLDFKFFTCEMLCTMKVAKAVARSKSSKLGSTSFASKTHSMRSKESVASTACLMAWNAPVVPSLSISAKPKSLKSPSSCVKCSGWYPSFSKCAVHSSVEPKTSRCFCLLERKAL